LKQRTGPVCVDKAPPGRVVSRPRRRQIRPPCAIFRSRQRRTYRVQQVSLASRRPPILPISQPASGPSRFH